MVTIIMVLNVHWSYILVLLAYNKVVRKKFEIAGDHGH